MQRRIGDITIESIAAESEKFAAPIVMVHGLWCTAAVWHRSMGFLAHRGWTCHAMNLRGHGNAGGRDAIARWSLTEHLSDLQHVIDLCDAPPVVMGHDLGGFLALACRRSATRAVVALAPLVPPAIGGSTNRALATWRARLAMLRSRPLPPPRGKLGTEYFTHTVPGGTTDESSHVARTLLAGAFSALTPCAAPTLLVAGEYDAFSPPHAVERLARHLGAQHLIAERAGHALPWDVGWEERTAATHRWIIQSLGEQLLLLRDDEDA